MSCYKTHDAVFDTGLRRAGRVEGSMKDEYVIHDIVAGQHHNQTTCCELRSLDPSTKVGRANRKIVDKIEKLIGQLR